MSIVSHQFGNFVVNQSLNVTEVNGIIIPHGFCSISNLCAVKKKRLNDYLSNKNTLSYFKAILEAESFDITAAGIPVADYERVSSNTTELGLLSGLLIQTKNAIGGEGEIYATLEISLDVASWVSPEIRVKANRVLAEAAKGNLQGLKEESQRIIEEYKQVWQEVRGTGKVTRRKLTDAIKDWYERNPDSTSCLPHVMYALTTNNIYRALWEMDAKQIETLLGCGRNESRDHMIADCLMVLERAEDRVCEFIDLDNIKPKDAVAIAQIRHSRIPLS